MVKLSPDRDHPATRGYACHKGLAALDIHRDPDRLDHPLLRERDGSFRRATWDEAIQFTADRLESIIATAGPKPLAIFTGNPTAFNTLATVHLGGLAGALGIRKTFGSGTQDCANKFVASEAVFGTSTVHPIPDLEHTDLCLIIGENPRASQGSFWSAPNLLGELMRARARGARVVFVNPRRIESADRGAGETLQIRPDTDVWFLAALLQEIDRLGGFDEYVVARHGRNIDGLRAFVAAYPAERGGRHHRHQRRGHRLPGPGVGLDATGVGARVDRSQHGPSGNVGVLARSDAQFRDRAAGRHGREPEERRLLSERPCRSGSARAGVRRHRVRPPAAGDLPGVLLPDAILESDDRFGPSSWWPGTRSCRSRARTVCARRSSSSSSWS